MRIGDSLIGILVGILIVTPTPTAVVDAKGYTEGTRQVRINRAFVDYTSSVQSRELSTSLGTGDEIEVSIQTEGIVTRFTPYASPGGIRWLDLQVQELDYAPAEVNVNERTKRGRYLLTYRFKVLDPGRSDISLRNSSPDSVLGDGIWIANNYASSSDSGVATVNERSEVRFIPLTLGSITPPAPRAGVRKPVVLLVDFSDRVGASTAGFFQSLLFSSSTQRASMRDYFNDVSYSKLDLDGTTYGWIRLPKTFAYYNSYSDLNGALHRSEFIADIMTLSDPIVNYADHDGDSNGYVDCVIVVYAGNNDSPYAKGLWPCAMSIDYNLDGKLIDRCTIQPEYSSVPGDANISLFCHEYGHVLGASDFAAISSMGLGDWSLMALNKGQYMDAWHRCYMGWANPVVVTTRSVCMIYCAESSSSTDTVYKIWIRQPSEYFLVENRQKLGWDSGLPGSGLLIYHIDESVASGAADTWYPGQASSGHYFCALEQADGRWDLERSVNAGDSGDPWPGSTSKTTFDTTSVPDSSSYSGRITNIGVGDIGASGTSMTAKLGGAISAAPALVLTYPHGGETLLVGSTYRVQWISSNLSPTSMFKLSYFDGVSWTPMATGIPYSAASYDWTVPRVNSLYCLVRVENDDGGTLATFDESDACFAVQSGGLWQKVSYMFTGNVYSLAIDPTNAETVYEATWSSGVVKSTNGGKTWTPVNTGLPSLHVRCVAIDPMNTQAVLAGTYTNGVFRSTNGGARWSQLNTGLTSTTVLSLAIDPRNTAVIYAAMDAIGIFRSTNSGASWTQMNSGLTSTQVNCIAVDPTNTQTLYAGTSGGVFKSANGGTSWREMSAGLTSTLVESLVVDPKNSEVIYVGVYGNGIFGSVNGGASWTQMNSGLTSTRVYCIAVDPTNTQTLYAGTPGGVFKSANGGANWSEMNAGLTSTMVMSLAIHPTNTGTIYAGTGGNGDLFKYTSPSVAPISRTPSAPRDLSVSCEGKSITLAWSPSSQASHALAGYAIYRGTSPGGEDSAPVAEVGVSTTTYTDTNVVLNTDYYYYVKAYDDQAPANYSESSKEARAKIIDTTPPDVSILHPVGGPTLETDSVVISGSATDSQSGIDRVTVGGNAVSISSDGTFSMTVSLSEGPNGIAVVAVDRAGNQATKYLSIAYRRPIQVTTIILWVGRSGFTVNGVSGTLDSPPVITNGRTLVPIRAIIEALGGAVGWDGTARKATVTLGSTSLELWIGKSTASVNGTSTPVDTTNANVVPEIINGRTMLPLRFVSENLGCSVAWEDATKTIAITYRR
jgi:M6 family metalloprotease-like protein